MKKKHTQLTKRAVLTGECESFSRLMRNGAKLALGKPFRWSGKSERSRKSRHFGRVRTRFLVNRKRKGLETKEFGSPRWTRFELLLPESMGTRTDRSPAI